ncbi:MAG: hypothetical protein U0Q07_03330 [Acidimicrobiales bacterium]
MSDPSATVLAGPVFAFAVLLGAAGALKLGRPKGAVRALRAAGLPGPALGVRALGVAEILLAAAVLAVGGRIAAALTAIAYLGFAAFTARVVVRSGATASCGCFGVQEAPANRLHVVLNVAAALVVATAVVWPTGGLLDVLADQPLAGVPFLVLTGLITWLWYVLYTVVPDWQEALAALGPIERDERTDTSERAGAVR